MTVVKDVLAKTVSNHKTSSWKTRNPGSILKIVIRPNKYIHRSRTSSKGKKGANCKEKKTLVIHQEHEQQ